MRSFKIGSRIIGAGHPCFIIAEAGVNHNGDLETAHRLIDAAADTGSDAVKFQTWITEKVCQPGAKKAKYQEELAPESSDQYSMLKKLELPFPWHAELKAHAEKRGIMFLSTPDEIDSARFLCGLGIEAIKIGSGELTNLPFLKQIAAFGMPIILSTGMGNLENVEAAVSAIQSTNEVPLALLHCVSAYPAAEEDMNLRCMNTLRDAFEVPVGLSDHTVGSLASMIAAGCGMAVFEKHLTLDRTMNGPDHAASAEPAEFTEVVKAIRRAERILGTGVKQPTEKEKEIRRAVQRSLVYSRELPAGHVLAEADIDALRSGLEGLPPPAAPQLYGRRLRTAVTAGKLVNLADAE